MDPLRIRMALVDGFTCAALRLNRPDSQSMRDEAVMRDLMEGLAAAYAGDPKTSGAWKIGIMAVRVLTIEKISVKPILEVVLSARTAKENGHPGAHDSLIAGVCTLIRKQMLLATGKDLPDPVTANTLSRPTLPNAHN